MTKFSNESMEVVTVNIPKSYLKYIKDICDKENAEEFLGFEPSRSEFFRHAVKDKIMRDAELSLFLEGEKRDWIKRERLNKIEMDLNLIKIPYTTKKKPL